MAKLTLHVPDELLVAAKKEAASRHVSVSKLISDYFRNLTPKKTENQDSSELKLAPITERLVGCLKDADITDYFEYLERKHL